MAAQKKPNYSTPALRAKRDLHILELFVGGSSERQIAAAVDLTTARVAAIIKAELVKEAGHQRLLSDKALSIYTTRLETLLAAVWASALDGDLKAVEVARRLLEQMGRLYDLEEQQKAGGIIPPVADNALAEAVDPILDTANELDTYRRRHEPGAQPTTEPDAAGA